MGPQNVSTIVNGRGNYLDDYLEDHRNYCNDYGQRRNLRRRSCGIWGFTGINISSNEIKMCSICGKYSTMRYNAGQFWIIYLWEAIRCNCELNLR